MDLEAIHSAPPEMLAQARAIIARYPQKRSATLPLLHLVQEHHGFISDADIAWVAAETETNPIEVLGVVTFYPMFRTCPVGKRHVRVCRTLSCALRGACHTMETLEKTFGIQHGETTPDGDITLEYVECLAACASGPVIQVNHALHEKVTPDRAKEFAETIRLSLQEGGYGKSPCLPNSPEWNG
ncbi:MAG: NAD(P)H-dependent oxidoreductase subunit E [Puniceicoccales bacterium]|jgi:NADH-quinone oxidoreductase subunit E|nr:NAD(P)H-dependent oxidoreductase subunit E [Puniceicoccales bacterium]